MPLKILKIPSMSKKEYDAFIEEQYLSRIAFKDEYPYIAPFLYVFDGSFIYFLSTKYGKKVELLKADPKVAVEIEHYESDMSSYRFVTLQGKIKEVDDADQIIKVKKMFINLFKNQELSQNALAALGHSPENPLESILNEDSAFVWKLVDVEKIVALRNL